MEKERREDVTRRAGRMIALLHPVLPVLSKKDPAVQTVCLTELLKQTLSAWIRAVNQEAGAEAMAQPREMAANMLEGILVDYIRKIDPAEIDRKTGSELFDEIVGDTVNNQ